MVGSVLVNMWRTPTCACMQPRAHRKEDSIAVDKHASCPSSVLVHDGIMHMSTRVRATSSSNCTQLVAVITRRSVPTQMISNTDLLQRKDGVR